MSLTHKLNDFLIFIINFNVKINRSEIAYKINIYIVNADYKLMESE